MGNSEIDDLVKTIKRGYLKYNLLKYSCAITLGFILHRCYKLYIVENTNYIAIICSITLMLLCIAAIIVSFRFRQSIIKHTEEKLNDIVLKQVEISYRLSKTDDNDYEQKRHLKQEETFLNKAFKKLYQLYLKM